MGGVIWDKQPSNVNAGPSVIAIWIKRFVMAVRVPLECSVLTYKYKNISVTYILTGHNIYTILIIQMAK